MTWAYLKRLGVGALELVLVVGLARSRRPASRPTRIAPRSPGERRLDDPPVARVVVERAGLAVLQVGRVDHQRQEQQQAEDRDGADRLVHRLTACTTWVASSSASSVVVGEVGHRPPGLVGDAQQQRDDHPVGDQRRAAVGQERRGQAGQRDQPGDAADDDEDLEREHAGQAGGDQLAEAVAADQGGAQRALDDQAVQQDAPRSPPVRPSSSPIAATMKSDSAKGTRSGLPSPKPRPIRPPQAMPNIASTGWNRCRRCLAVVGRTGRSQMSTRVWTWREELVGRRSAPPTNSSAADHQPAGPLGGDVEHDQEEAEEQQARAEVAAGRPGCRG